MSATAAWDLAWALIMVLVVFLLATGSKRTWAIGALLIMIPFQMVETRYASSSVLMAYALAAVLLVNGGLKVRMLPALGLIILAYLVSLSQADRVILSLHALFAFQFFSCLVVFLLAYNFARLAETDALRYRHSPDHKHPDNHLLRPAADSWARRALRAARY